MLVSKVAGRYHVLFPKKDVEAMRKTPLSVGLPKGRWVQYTFSGGGTYEGVVPKGLSGTGHDRLLAIAQKEVNHLTGRT